MIRCRNSVVRRPRPQPDIGQAEPLLADELQHHGLGVRPDPQLVTGTQPVVGRGPRRLPGQLDRRPVTGVDADHDSRRTRVHRPLDQRGRPYRCAAILSLVVTHTPGWLTMYASACSTYFTRNACPETYGCSDNAITRPPAAESA